MFWSCFGFALVSILRQFGLVFGFGELLGLFWSQIWFWLQFGFGVAKACPFSILIDIIVLFSSKVVDNWWLYHPDQDSFKLVNAVKISETHKSLISLSVKCQILHGTKSKSQAFLIEHKKAFNHSWTYMEHQNIRYKSTIIIPRKLGFVIWKQAPDQQVLNCNNVNAKKQYKGPWSLKLRIFP